MSSWFFFASRSSAQFSVESPADKVLGFVVLLVVGAAAAGKMDDFGGRVNGCGLPAGFAGDGVENSGEFVIFGEFGGPPVHHFSLLWRQAGPPGADLLADAVGGDVKYVGNDVGGQCVLQPGGDEAGLLRFVQRGDVEGEMIIPDGAQAGEMHGDRGTIDAALPG